MRGVKRCTKLKNWKVGQCTALLLAAESQMSIRGGLVCAATSRSFRTGGSSMPSAPGRACTCGGIVRQGVCDRCGPKRRTQYRKHAAARGYDYQWQQFRKRYLALNPLCMDCKKIGIVTAATAIHHVQKLKPRPDLKYEESNLMPLCKMHHDRRTAKGE